MLNSLTTTAATDALSAKVAAIYAYLAANVEVSLVLTQKTTPTPEQRTLPWNRLNSDGTPDRIYNWSGTYNLWVARHPIAPDSLEVITWKGTSGNLATYQGGTSGSVTDISGPFWTEDTAFEAKFPLGAGTLPSGTVVAVEATGGVENVQLELAQAPGHFHGTGIAESTDANQLVSRTWSSAEPGQIFGQDWTASPTSSGVVAGTAGTLGTTDPITNGDDGTDHTNMPPYIGVLFAKRTARIFFVAPTS